jgi:predicted dehydrogenase
MNSKRLAIFGCGGIAAAHALAIQGLGPDQCVVGALYDIDSKRATAFGSEFFPKAHIFTDPELLLHEISPDAVVICTPPSSHASLAVLCLVRDVPVLCEKPLSSEAPSAKEVVEMAKKRGTILRTASKYRFTDGVLAASRCVAEQSLGNIEHVYIGFGAPVSMAGRWQVNPSLSGGGVLMDNGPHAIDLARFMLGDVELTKINFGFTAGYGVEDEAHLKLQSYNGVPIEIDLSWQRSLGEVFLTIVGTKATCSVGWNATFRQQEGGPPEQIASRYDKERAFTRQLKTFLDEIDDQVGMKGAEQWRIDDGLRVVEIISRAYARRL